MRPPLPCRPVSAGQSNIKISKFSTPAFDPDIATVPLRYDITVDWSPRPVRSPRTAGTACPLSRRDARTVVADADFNRSTAIPRHLQDRPEFRVASLLLAFCGGIEAIAEQVEIDAGNVLGASSVRAMAAA
jgi:hypothetical protein